MNINILNIIEVLFNADWLERSCNVQKKWFLDYRFVEIMYYSNMDIYILINYTTCYINIQHYNNEQLLKKNLNPRVLPKELYNFVITEPIASLGSTNLMWLNSYELNSLNNEVNDAEKSFINIFFDEPTLKNINILLSIKSKIILTNNQFEIILHIIKTKNVSLDSLQRSFNVKVKKVQMRELLEIIRQPIINPK